MRNSGGGHPNGDKESLETSEDKYVVLLNGETKIQSRAQASCGPDLIGISVSNFFLSFFFFFLNQRRAYCHGRGFSYRH